MSGKIRGIDATTTEKGVLRIATQQEVNTGTVKDAVVTPETLKNLPANYIPLPVITFNSFKKAQVNHAYILVDPDPEAQTPLELPDRGSFKRGDILEVDNLSGKMFKITIPQNSAVEIRYDNELLTDLSGKFLLSEGPGSSIKLRAESTQLWYVVRRDRVTISAGS